MSKKHKYLFQSPEAAFLWEKSHDARLEIVKLGDCYPELYMPPEVAKMEVEVLTYYIFKDKDKNQALEWLDKNIENT